MGLPCGDEGRQLFFGAVVVDPIVRNGADYKHGAGAHTARNVYVEMLRQVCRDYPGLPDPRTLRLNEIVFFYDGLRAELKRATRKNQQGPAPKARTPKRHG